MRNNQINRKIKESLILITGITFLIVLGIAYTPLVLLFPAVYSIFALRNGINLGIANLIITGILTGIMVGVELAVSLLIFVFPMTFVMTYLIKKRRKSIEVLGISTVTFFILVILLVKLMEIKGINFIAILEESFSQAIMTQLELYQDMGLTSLELLERRDLLEGAYKQVLLIMPSIILIVSLVINYINYLLTTYVLDKMDIKLHKVPKFSRFKLPNNIILGILAIFIGFYSSKYIGFQYYEETFINLNVLIGVAFFIQGLAVIQYTFNRRKINHLIRIILYVIFLFIAPVITIIGIIDTIFDIRKLRGSRSL